MICSSDGNMELVENYLKHDDIFHLIEPNKAKDDFKPENSQNIKYFIYALNGDINGIIVCEYRANWYVNFHPYMQKKHRGCKHDMISCFEQLARNMGIKKLTVEFPCMYENLKNFAEECGYKMIGINDMSYNYKGSIIDQYIYGKVI